MYGQLTSRYGEIISSQKVSHLVTYCPIDDETARRGSTSYLGGIQKEMLLKSRRLEDLHTRDRSTKHQQVEQSARHFLPASVH